jgi:hypothetical protein
LHKEAGYDKIAARLGLKMLYSILGSANAEVKLENRPAWITSDRLGILTVESFPGLATDLGRLGISVFQQKTADVPDTILLDLIEKVIENQKS